LKKIKWIFSPRSTYRTSKKSLNKRGMNGVVEVPLSALLFPYLGSTMRIFPTITSIIRYLLFIESSIIEKPIVFDIHPNELIDESCEINKSRKITRRTNSLIDYLLKDYLRSKLKTRNLGINACRLYNKEIDFFLKKKFRFFTIKDYVIKSGFDI
jgi:hypothetical protein